MEVFIWLNVLCSNDEIEHDCSQQGICFDDSEYDSVMHGHLDKHVLTCLIV